MKSLYASNNKQKRLRREVDSPRSHPNTITALDVIKFEHVTNKGKGGLQKFALKAQQYLGMSDDKRYSEGRETSLIADCGFKLLDSNNKTFKRGFFTNMLAGSSAIRL